MGAKRIATGVTAGIAGGAALIGVISVVSRIVGFGRQLVFQSTVGQTVLGEIYATINALPNVVFEIVAGGALTSVVVPLIAAAAAHGDTSHVRQTVSALLGWTLVVLVPVALLGALLAGPIAELILRGRGGADGVEAGRTMLLIFLPQIPLYGIAVVTVGVLQAHRRFLAPAVAPIVSSVVVATAFVAFARVFTGDLNELSTLDRRSELFLAGGTTVGVLALALVTLVPMVVRVTGLRPTLSFPPGTGRRAAGLAGAGLATLTAQQLAYLTSYLMSNEHAGTGGAVTFLNSWMVYLLPYAVLAVPIATAAFPRLATSAEGDPDGYARTLAGSTRAVLAASGAGAAVLVATAWPVARFFGYLDQGDVPTERMAWALIAFAPGLLGYGLVAHLGRALYARGRGRVAATAMASGWLLVVLAAVVLAGIVHAERVTAALGAAHSLGMTLAGILLIRAVVGDSGRAALAGVGRLLGGVVVGAILGGAAGWWVGERITGDGAGSIIGAGVVSALAATVVVGGILMVTDRKAFSAVLRR
ncbi:virulence factor MviN [Actinobacteria bacterium YIM 96077]|uniref:Virulence factor MviN n=1 Tax=Phytoactinopolyspora halophila TaxID=1981511 RepID=A0A329QG93_9ACTN|nr:lipid II flippase MurJ [Phytoactinopolyspora halophila]AYY13615.1 virulence factor MviN [Actinobacteria bacterium YIM 96077]RAW10719.1 virulence factor MviN [Phytoactinopolyspora halophila]